MSEEVLQLWKSGLSKTKIAQRYRLRFNQYIRLMRLDMKHRNAGRIINNKQALPYVDTIIRVKKEQYSGIIYNLINI